MATRFQVEGKITATDEASVVIERVSRNMEQFGSRARASQQTFAAATRESTQAVRAMTTGLLNELSPALATAVDRFSMAAREARQLPGAMGAVTVGFAAVALGIGAFIERLKETQAINARINFAEKAADLQTLRGVMKEASEAAQLYNDRLKAMAEFQKKGWAQMTPEGLWTRLKEGMEDAFNFWSTTIGKAPKEFKADAERAAEAVRKLVPLESARIQAEGGAKIGQAQLGFLGVGAEVAQSQLNLEEFLATMEQIRIEAQRVTVQLQEAARARARFEERAAEARTELFPGARDIEIRQIRDALNLELRAIGVAGGAQQAGIAERLRTGGAAIQQGLNPSTAAERLAQAEVQANAQATAGIQAGDEGIRAMQEKRLTTARELAAVQRDAYGLTQSEVAQRERQVIEADALLKIEQSRRGVGDENLAIEERRTKLQSLARQEAERGTLVGGFEKATREIADEWTATGRLMEDTTRRTAGNMGALLSAGMRGKGREAGQIFAENMLQTVTDAISQWVVGTAFKNINQILPGGAGPGPLGNAAPNAVNPATIRGAINLTGVTGSQVEGLQQMGYQIVTTPVGQMYAVPGTFSLPRAGGTPTGIGDAFQAPGTLGTGGASGFNYAGAAGAGIAVGVAAYSAYQFYEATSRGAGGAGATSRGAFAGGIGGLASGITAGAAVGSLFPGYGTLIGAVVGAVIGLTAGGSLGGLAGSEAEGRGNKERRRAQRLKQGRRVVESIANILDRPDALNASGGQGIDFVVRQPVDSSGITLGGVLAGLGELLGHPIAGFLAGQGVTPQAYNYERINNLTELMLSMGGPFAVGKILDAALQQLQGIEDRANAIEQGTQLTYTEQLLGGITRQTILPVSGLDEYNALYRGAGTGTTLSYSTAVARKAGVTDTEVAYLVGRIRQYLGDADAQDLTETAWLRMVPS